MPLIHLTNFIAATPERVFDLSLSVDLHKYSMKHHEERVVDGTMQGLMKLHDTVTWKAKHLYKERMMTIKITQWNRPHFFVDEQESGDFTMMKHEHYFKAVENGTIMIDQFRFESPRGFIGHWANRLFLTNYIRKLLQERNAAIKSAAEGSQWKQFLSA
jgi:ligand-binding SRPBCC domain-containing protein